MADGRLGLIAGSGALPGLVLAECTAQNRSCFTVAFRGHTDPAAVRNVPHMWARLGRAGATVRRLRREGVRDIVMAGGIRRPSLTELVPDLYTLRFLAGIGRQALGDDGLLRAITGLFEREGFHVLGIQDLVPSLLAPQGRFGAITPTGQQLADIRTGFRAARMLGALDIGQSVVVQQGIVLAVEAAEGTDALIGRAAALVKPGSGAVMVKCAKPQQDARLDLPTIGVNTIRAAAQAGFAGIAVEAGRTLVIDLATIAREADKAGLFIMADADDG